MMSWMVLLTLLLCIAASALSVMPTMQTAARRLSIAAMLAMAVTGCGLLLVREQALADALALSPVLWLRALLAVAGCGLLGLLAAWLLRRGGK